MPVDISKIAASNKSSSLPAMSEYDVDWGYYTFSQTIQYEYDDIGKTGLSGAIITVNGCFTTNSVNSGNYPYSKSDPSKCDALIDKYKNLREMFLATLNKPAPSKMAHVGTINDKRCVKLPDKLKDSNNSSIYAMPTSFYTTEISPEVLKYTVVFSEPKKTTCKLAVDKSIIDNAILSITCRKPRIAYRNYAFANGRDSYFYGIDNRKYSISGTICGADSDGKSISTEFVNGMSEIMNKKNGVVGVSAKKIDDESNSSSSFNMIVTNHNFGHVFSNGMATVEISGEECLPEYVEKDYDED
jgi:hypothetical protein